MEARLFRRASLHFSMNFSKYKQTESLAKSSYYQIKNRFLDNIYVLCVYSGLVKLRKKAVFYRGNSHFCKRKDLETEH